MGTPLTVLTLTNDPLIVSCTVLEPLAAPVAFGEAATFADVEVQLCPRCGITTGLDGSGRRRRRPKTRFGRRIPARTLLKMGAGRGGGRRAGGLIEAGRSAQAVNQRPRTKTLRKTATQSKAKGQALRFRSRLDPMR